MSRHARIEEVSSSDSDPDDMDPSDFDPSPFPIQPGQPASSSTNPSHMAASQIPAQIPQNTTRDLTPYKSHQSLYPIYFSSLHTRAQGRRVSKDLAVPNPLARDIADAVSQLGLGVLFEAGKLHPKDWANPGRVKVLVKKDGYAVNPRVHNKHHLYILVAKYLREHPSTEASVRRLKVPGLDEPDPSKPLPDVAVPRGWKINQLVPLHSPARGGGGVSEGMLKDMMAGMGGMIPGGATVEAEKSGSGKPKKIKRKIIRA